MSRMTQYIGLTDDATNWTSKAANTETYEMTQGMFGEPVLGTVYYLSGAMLRYGSEKDSLVAREVEQICPGLADQ